MPWPRISIVTPSYNQGKFIERTVRSVLLQRYPDLEYILMDGGSTDDTVDRIAPYKHQFSYFVSEPDKGQADAIANGFARSSGEIMAYLNSDDLLAPDTLHFVANFFKANPNIDWIYSHRCFIDDDDRVTGYWILPPHQNFLMRRWDYIPQETCFWRRRLFEKSGNIDRSYRFAMDYDLFVRFMSRGRGRRLNRFLGAFRDHSTSKTKQLLATVGAHEMLRVRQKFMIRASITDGIFGLLLGNWVQYAGRYFAAAAYSLPGGLPGAGYDYNDLWAGLLRPAELQLGPAERRPKNEEDGYFTPLCPITLGLADKLLMEIASFRAGEVAMNPIYLNSKSRVAIIGPPTSPNQQTQASDLCSKQQVSSVPPFDAESPDPPGIARLMWTVLKAIYGLRRGFSATTVGSKDQTADQILSLTRDLVSANDEVTFLDAAGSNAELLDALKAQTKWKLFDLKADTSLNAETFSSLRQSEEVAGTSKGFDLIHLGQSVQCFEEPRATLRALAISLNVGGFLFLTTPNLESEQRKLFGSAWVCWKPEKNRYIYCRKSLKKLLKQAGFSLMKLRTVSTPESTAGSLKRLDNGFSSKAACDHLPEWPGAMNAAMITRISNLFWDKLGRGDEILAVFRRVW